MLRQATGQWGDWEPVKEGGGCGIRKGHRENTKV